MPPKPSAWLLQRPAGLYVHVPFCRRKCTYCDFPSFAGLQAFHTPYVDALLGELRLRAADWRGTCFDSLYFGGGTPSLLSPEQIAALITACRRELDLAPDAEITLEANPGTVDEQRLADLLRAGVNRLSLGVQSLQHAELTLLGRIHDPQGAIAAVRAARAAGFTNLSLDLMFGLPEQELASWESTLDQALALTPEHLSLYALTVEEGTPLARDIACGLIPPPDDDRAADMYLLAEERLAGQGLAHYEISNWARRSSDGTRISRHNLHYWHNERYLGLGAAATSYDGIHRATHGPDPVAYIKEIASGVIRYAAVERPPRAQRMDETMMLGLRLMAGVRWETFRQRFGIALDAVYGSEIDELVAVGLLERGSEGIRLTERGYLLGNRVFARFLRT